MALSPDEHAKVKEEMGHVIFELKRQGINHNTKENERRGLGDQVESTLNYFGITQERYKDWLALEECHCEERKKWMNNLFSWAVKEK